MLKVRFRFLAANSCLATLSTKDEYLEFESG